MTTSADCAPLENAPESEPHSDYAASAMIDRRLTVFRSPHGPALGAEYDGGILNIAATARTLELPAPRDLDEMLQAGRGAEVVAVLDALRDAPQKAVVQPLEEIEFAPLVTRPEKILCVGFNYRKHAEETKTPIPTEPPLFSKFANALNRHNGSVALPMAIDDQFDYETELVIIIGREGKNIDEASALSHVAGYTIGNDISARRRQTATTQFLAGKAADGFAPLGPWFASRKLITDPNALRLRTFMNGESRQDWTTGDMIFDCRKLIAYVSSIMTIKPGDILFTGTPQGVIFGQSIPAEKRRWLRPGDEVVSLIEGLGELRVLFE